MPDPDATQRARDAIRTLLAARGAGKTICPSEAARAMGGAAWREAMPVVHAAVARLVAEGEVRLSWRGAARAVADGPYRIGRPPPST